MEESFIIQGVDVMAQDSKTALEMLVQERQVIEYWYNKDEDTRKGGLEKFVKLIQLMLLKADPDDDEETSYGFQSIRSLLNFFDSAHSLEEREKALEILDYVKEQGFSFTGTSYIEHTETNLRDYLLKNVYEKRLLIEKMYHMGVDLIY